MAKGKTQFDFVVNTPFNVVNTTIQNWLVANKFKPIEGVVWGQPGSYLFNDPIVEGKRGFDYVIHGNKVTIWAYVGSSNKPMPLDDSLVGAMPKQRYKNLLTPLFQELEKLNGNTSVNNQIPAQSQYRNPVNPQVNTQNNQQQNAYGAYAQHMNRQTYNVGNLNQNNFAQSPQPAHLNQQNPTFVVPQSCSANTKPNSMQVNQFVDDINKKGEKFAVAAFIISLVSLVLPCIGVAPGGLLVLLNYWFASQGLQTKKRGLSIAAIVITSISLVLLIASIALQFFLE